MPQIHQFTPIEELNKDKLQHTSIPRSVKQIVKYSLVQTQRHLKTSETVHCYDEKSFSFAQWLLLLMMIL